MKEKAEVFNVGDFLVAKKQERRLIPTLLDPPPTSFPQKN
jgi:hypothetical protein